MAAKNYYKILGISKNAGDAEIKKAFRKQAMKSHPDRHQGDKNAEEKFKEINEAYAVLSDPKKRKQYDMFGAEGFQQRFSQEDIFKNFDLGSIFKDMGFGFGTGSQRSRHSPFGQQTGDFGFGSGFNMNDFQQQAVRKPTKGTDLDYELSIDLKEVVFGSQKKVVYRAGREKKEITVKIPVGIADGQKLRLAGKGLKDNPDLPPGDLFFNIKIQHDPMFQIEGNDLVIEKEIRFSEAVLGGSIEIPTLDGNKKIRIPAGTKGNTKMRLKGLGMPVFRSNRRGDLYAKLIISVPKKLTSLQKKLIQDVAKADI